MTDAELLLLVARTISRNYRDEAIRSGTWKSKSNDTEQILLSKVKNADPECHAQIMREAAAILEALDRAGVFIAQ